MTDETPEWRAVNARLVTPEGVVEGAITVADGLIAAIEPGAGGPGEDFGGDWLLPGVVDVHTDHFEKHVFPRPRVRWDPVTAAMAHDVQMIGGGTTTVFDALCVGASLKNTERREILGDCLDAFDALAAEGAFRAEHYTHLRCEVSDPDTLDLAAAEIDRPRVAAVSVMDHTPGRRQSKDVDVYLKKVARDMQLHLHEAKAMVDDLIARSDAHGERVRDGVVALARARGLPLMSHDDDCAAHVALAVGEGAAIAEFPTTLEAAEAARAAGLVVVVGAPNLLRGGSQSGNVAVRDLMRAGVADVFASDYVPRSPLDAAFAAAEDPELGLDLPAAVAMATSAPAASVGLTDRGALREGLRADLVRARRAAGRVHVRAVWVAGARAA